MGYVFIVKYVVPGITNAYCNRVGILLTYEKHLYDRIISTRREMCVHKTTLTLSLLIEAPVPNQQSE